jgi:hypothetical protein
MLTKSDDGQEFRVRLPSRSSPRNLEHSGFIEPGPRLVLLEPHRQNS